MQLLLLRHADAVPSAPSDDLRTLSDKGRAQAKRIGRFCHEHELKPDLILTSPFRRAEDTARIVATELKSEATVAGFLSPGMSPATAVEALMAYQRLDSVMLVGHEPDLSLLASRLLDLVDNSAIRFRKATLAGIDIPTLRPGGGELDFLIPAKLV
ncbi:MAG: phosphohistidine phosphatase SixA [Verrucomicrobiota bacterium]